MDKLAAMKTFVRVAELGSFTKAAEQLALPKASVSNSIQQLETLTGVRLLHRTTRKVQMTQDGITFYERCKDLLSDAEDVTSMFQKNQTDITGRIRVDMPNGIAKNLVLPRLPEFTEQYPNVEFEISCTDRKVDLIREGFDCVIRVGNLVDSGLIARPLGKFAIANLASPKYLKKFGIPRKIEDLSTHHMIHYVGTLGTKPDGFEYFDGEKYRLQKMNGSITVNSTEAYQQTCLSGYGIIQAPFYGVKGALKDGSLIEILSRYKAEPMPVSLVYPHRRNLARRVQLFMEWVQKITKKDIE